MTAQAQMKVIKKITANKPFLKIGKVLNVLEHGRRVINRRRANGTDLKLEHEIRMCEIRRCLLILNSM